MDALKGRKGTIEYSPGWQWFWGQSDGLFLVSGILLKVIDSYTRTKIAFRRHVVEAVRVVFSLHFNVMEKQETAPCRTLVSLSWADVLLWKCKARFSIGVYMRTHCVEDTRLSFLSRLILLKAPGIFRTNHTG